MNVNTFTFHLFAILIFTGKTIIFVLAEPRQGVKSSFWCLPNLGKGQNHHFCICRTSARGKTVILVFAELRQEVKPSFLYLPNLGKGQNHLFCICRTSARGKIIFLYYVFKCTMGLLNILSGT
jgi:hypothetical protein